MITGTQSKMAAAAVQAILAHQAKGCGLRPPALWDDADLIDSGLLFEALTSNELDPTDANNDILQGIVSPIVFGAFYQDSSHFRIKNAIDFLNSAGYAVAELKFINVNNYQLVSDSSHLPPYLTKLAFDPETIEAIDKTMANYDKFDGYRMIAGYFLLPKDHYLGAAVTRRTSTLDTTAVIDEIAEALASLDGHDLAERYNQLVDDKKVIYLGDSLFIRD
jgi:hypothetical protein